MSRKLAKGIDLLNEVVGEGPAAAIGAIVTFNARFYLRQGDEVTRDAEIIAGARANLETRFIDGIELIDHVTKLGKRHPIAGVERSLQGMRAKGYREVLVSPHLAYGDEGIPSLIPPRAMLRVQLWVWTVASRS